MKTIRSALLCTGVTLSALAHASNWTTAQLSYAPEGWSAGQVYGLNNSGQVIGVINPSGPPPANGPIETVPMAFVTGPNGSNLHPIDPSYTPYVEYCHGCHTDSTPQAINNAGQIAIANYVAWTGALSVTLAGPNGGNIPTPPAALFAPAVILHLNNSGQVAGTFYGPPVGFVTDANGSNPHLLGMLDNNYDSNVSGINNSGQLLVSGVLTGSTTNETFITGANGNGVATILGGIGTNYWFSGINDSAQVIGSYQEPISGEYHAFVSGGNGQGLMDIGSLGGQTIANSLSDNGLVVGESGGRAFLYGLNGGGMIDLNTLVTLDAGELLISAEGVNDHGQIVAESNLGNMYLLSPVSEPGTHLLMLGGLALLYGYSRRRFT